ncbi:MAG: FixH family protein [Magnetococcales bacterium]|nr:FixH family protein [Magnetococcales bacterium]
MPEQALPATKPLLRRWEGWSLSLVLFACVVIVANIALVYFATSSWTGLVTQNSYEKGLAFNQVLTDQHTQDKLGWRGTLQSDTLRAGVPGPMLFTLVRDDGTPLRGARVTLELFRPVAAGHDQNLDMLETSPGQYKTSVSFSLPGVWEVKIRAVVDQATFRYAQRLTIGAP